MSDYCMKSENKAACFAGSYSCADNKIHNDADILGVSVSFLSARALRLSGGIGLISGIVAAHAPGR